MSAAETLLSSLELQGEPPLRVIRSGNDTLDSWHKYVNSFDVTVHRLFEIVDRTKTELQRRSLLGSLEDTCGSLHFDFAGYIMSQGPYIGISEFAASKKEVCRCSIFFFGIRLAHLAHVIFKQP